jgi:hypothetical protein
MAKRHIIRIELSGQAKQNIGKLSDNHGMTNVAMISRLVGWFAEQDVTMQSAVVGRFATGSNLDTATMVLERMARGE